MRTYALFILALGAFHARAATIPAPVETEKKLPDEKKSLDNVSLDNNDSEQELIDQANPLKDIENNLRISTSVENVPVKIIEEQPVIKTVALKENSNDYIPDIDDTIIIKRVEIDLKNPGPPQRQEHDSQNPAYYVDRERVVAAIKQSIAESESIFKSGIQDVAQNFHNLFENNEELTVIKQNIQNLKDNVNAGVSKLTDTINSYLKPTPEESTQNQVEVYNIEEVETRLKTLNTKFNTGVDILSEGVEILSILKEQEEEVKSDKISGKADNAAEASTPTGASPANPGPGAGTAFPAQTIPFFDYIQNFSDTISVTFNNIQNAFQNALNPNQNSQNENPNQTQNFNILQSINPFQGFNQNQNQNQAQGTAPAGAQSDETSTERPSFVQQISNTWQDIIKPQNSQQQQPQQNQNPFTSIWQGIANIIQRPTAAPQTTQPTNEANNAAAGQPASDTPVAVAPVTAQGSNSVPAPSAPTAQAAPAAPVVAQPAQNAVQPGPIQQIVQNNPIVKGITQAVQRIQSASNPSSPRDTPKKDEETKGHKPSNAATGDNHDSGVDGSELVQSVSESLTSPVEDEPEAKPASETQTGEREPAAELNKTE